MDRLRGIGTGNSYQRHFVIRTWAAKSPSSKCLNRQWKWLKGIGVDMAETCAFYRGVTFLVKDLSGHSILLPLINLMKKQITIVSCFFGLESD